MKREQKQGTARTIAAHILRGLDDLHVVVGPKVSHPDEPTPYFVVAGHEGGAFRCDLIRVEGDTGRQAVIIALLQPGARTTKGLVCHTMDDELDMARLCHGLWPCEKTKGILTAVEAERAAA